MEGKELKTFDPKDALHNLDISETVVAALHKAEVYTISDLCQLPSWKLSNIQGIGPKKQIMLKQELARMGRSLT
jgi:DNA-directed RNA polymerase alpha subunit